MLGSLDNFLQSEDSSLSLVKKVKGKDESNVVGKDKEVLTGKESKWELLKERVAEISPGSIDQHLAFSQVLAIMEELENQSNTVGECE